MTTEMLQLRHLGWQTIDGGQRLKDGRWCLLAMRYRETIIVLADSREEAWSVASSMAVRLTCG
jgi:hypothetical protein